MKRITSLLLVAILIIAQLSPNISMVYAQEDSSIEEVNYTVDQAYDQDSNTTSITVNAQPSFGAVTVDSITAPESEATPGGEVTYVADANGRYTFTVNYTVEVEDDESITSGSAVTVDETIGQESKTLDIKVDVTDIIEKAELLAEGEEVAINAENFPDASFRSYVESFDLNKDKKLNQEERDKVIKIGTKGEYGRIDTVSAGSFQGIEYFTELEELYCKPTIIMQELNVSNNKKLKILYAQGDYDYTPGIYKGNFKEFNITQNTKLIELDVSDNNIKKLDLSANTNLEILKGDKNRFKTLNISQNENLKELYLSDNEIKAMDLKNNKNLLKLYLSRNQLTELDLSENKALISLVVDDNQLTKLDVMHLEQPSMIYCNNNKLATFVVNENIALGYALATTQKVSPSDIWVRNGDVYEFDMKQLVGVDNLSYIIDISGGDGFIGYDKNEGIITSSEEIAFVYEYDLYAGKGPSLGSAVPMDVSVEAPGWYSINAIAGKNGSINPSGGRRLKEGTNQTYEISPNEGYEIDQLFIDGYDIPEVSSIYEFQDIRSNHSIEVTFKLQGGSTAPKEYYIAAVAKSGGSINPSGVKSVAPGSAVTYTIEPDPGNIISKIIIDGKETGPKSTVNLKDIRENHRIEVFFKMSDPSAPSEFSVQTIATTKGTITPNGETVVKFGEDYSYEIKASPGYKIEQLLINNDPVSLGSSDLTEWSTTISNIRWNYTIEAIFEKNDSIQEGEVEIHPSNFPDPYFRADVRAFDLDGNGILSKRELEDVTEIRIDS